MKEKQIPANSTYTKIGSSVVNWTFYLASIFVVASDLGLFVNSSLLPYLLETYIIRGFINKFKKTEFYYKERTSYGQISN